VLECNGNPAKVNAGYFYNPGRLFLSKSYFIFRSITLDIAPNKIKPTYSSSQAPEDLHIIFALSPVPQDYLTSILEITIRYNIMKLAKFKK
jgi:hypothetical protein